MKQTQKPLYQIKDISNSGTIKSTKDSESIKIKTTENKYTQYQDFAKTNEEKKDTYKQTILEENADKKQKNVTEKTENATKNFTKNQKERGLKTDKKSSNISLSRNVLKGSEYILDELLDNDDDDLGVDTIVKTKIGIKKSAKLTQKNYEVSKKVGQKVYKVATSDNAKKIYAGTAKVSKKTYEKTMDFSRKVYAKQKVKSFVKYNSLKERQKREIKKNARKKMTETAGRAISAVVGKLKDVLVSLLTKKVVLIGLIIITLVITIVSAIVGITSLFAYSVNLALDDNITMITEYISELDYNINSQIDFAPDNYPYVDRFVYNVPQRAETNHEQVYAYLKAKYGDQKISETVIKAEIRQIHDRLYDIDFEEKTRRWTTEKEDGTKVRHSRTTMTITLTSESFAEFYRENKNSLLEENQQQDYENILKLMEENVGKILNNPFPKVDWRKYVTSEYGYRIHPITEKKSKHTGIDISLEDGTEIHSCISGVVETFDDGEDGFGLYLTITNGVHTTLYAHCSEIIVSDGEKVNAGDVIAKVGNTGQSTGAHLHLEYWVNGIKKNPRAYLKIYEE